MNGSSINHQLNCDKPIVMVPLTILAAFRPTCISNLAFAHKGFIFNSFSIVFSVMASVIKTETFCRRVRLRQMLQILQRIEKLNKKRAKTLKNQKCHFFSLFWFFCLI